MGNQAFPITNAMKQILTQVRDCQYTGALKRVVRRSQSDRTSYITDQPDQFFSNEQK
jgi:hypothetical protein